VVGTVLGGAVVFGAAAVTRGDGDGGFVVAGALAAARVVLATGVLGPADVAGAGGTVGTAVDTLLVGVPVSAWLWHPIRDTAMKAATPTPTILNGLPIRTYRAMRPASQPEVPVQSHLLRM
jgi:hypothetical protein